ncbi:MAG: CotH kinase family protein [Promethearchaeota archaeon]
MSHKIKFKNQTPISKKKKSLLIFVLLGSLTLTPTLYFSLRFSPIITSELPRIYILSSEEITSDTYTDCEIVIQDEVILAKIRIRGEATEHHPKDGYRFELSKQRSLLGMREDDDWQLFSMWCDLPRMRIKLSIDLWRSLEETNPTAILPDSRYVNLYLNRAYQGFYLLLEKNDRKLFQLEDAQNNIDSSLIFQVKGSTSLREYEEDCWEQDWPNEDEGIFIMEDIVTDLIYFIKNANNSEFFNLDNGIYTIFDKNNLIDFYLYNFFIYHNDFWDNNYFLIRNTAPHKFFLIPWDFDGSFGQLRGKLFDADLSHESFIKENNELFNRLLSNTSFLQECKDRWFELREKLWTKNFILDMLSDMYEEIKEIIEYDVNMSYKPSMEQELSEYIDDLFEWIPDRLDFCDSYFEKY